MCIRDRFCTGQCPCVSRILSRSACTWTLASPEPGQGHGSFFKSEPQSQPSYLEVGCAVTLLCVHSFLSSAIPWWNVSVIPVFSIAPFFVFAEKGIIIFMIFRAGRAHLTANPSGRRARACTKPNACWGFFNCSAYRGGGPETI